MQLKNPEVLAMSDPSDDSKPSKAAAAQSEKPADIAADTESDSFKSANSPPTTPTGASSNSRPTTPTDTGASGKNYEHNGAGDHANNGTKKNSNEGQKLSSDTTKSMEVDPSPSNNDKNLTELVESPKPDESRPTSEMSWNSELKALETSGENSPKPTESLLDLDSSTDNPPNTQTSSSSQPDTEDLEPSHTDSLNQPKPTNTDSKTINTNTLTEQSSGGETLLKPKDKTNVDVDSAKDCEVPKDPVSEGKNSETAAVDSKSNNDGDTIGDGSKATTNKYTPQQQKVTEPQSAEKNEAKRETPDKENQTGGQNKPAVSQEGVKTVFNIEPSQSTGPNAQDIKDGHAYLRPMPKVLYQLGLSLMREVVYEGLSKHVAESRERGDKKYSFDQYKSLHKSLQNLRKENKGLKVNFNKVCPAIIDGRECGFRTESSIALETHMSTSHFNRAGRYCCARCDYTCAHPSYFRNHVLEKHGLISVVVRPEAFFTCKMCLYETNNSQARLDTHMQSCTKSFVLNKNCASAASDNTPLDEKIFKVDKPPLVATRASAPPPINPKTHQSPSIVTKSTGGPQGQSLQTTIAERLNTAAAKKAIVPKLDLKSFKMLTNTPGGGAPEVRNITQIGGTANSDICQCEVCDGYIQGIQAMRVHMQWCHNINITNIYKPEVRCPIFPCTASFYTVQGLARHSRRCRLHPSVNVSKTGFFCFICLNKYQTSQVEHMLAKHLPDLKRMVETKQCFAHACMGKSIKTQFSDVNQLQTHLASVHKLRMTGLSGLGSTSLGAIKFQPFCSICKLKFDSSAEFGKHCSDNHVHLCDLCGVQCSTKLNLKVHNDTAHPLRYCIACDKSLMRKSYISHVLSTHKACHVRLPVKRLSDDLFQSYMKKPRRAEWWPEETQQSLDKPATQKSSAVTTNKDEESTKPGADCVEEKEKMDSSEATTDITENKSAAAKVGEETSDTQVEKTSEKEEEKPAGKLIEKTSEVQVEKTTEKQTDNISRRQEEKLSESKEENKVTPTGKEQTAKSDSGDKGEKTPIQKDVKKKDEAAEKMDTDEN